MTTPAERTRAMIAAGNFLVELTAPYATPRVPKEIRERAKHLLRHYPTGYDVLVAAEKAPEIFGEWK